MARVSGTMEKMADKVQQVFAGEPGEGTLTKRIERQTAKIPSLGFLGLAVGSMIASMGLAIANKKELANFVGLWAPSILLIGVYNKLVKLEGHD